MIFGTSENVDLAIVTLIGTITTAIIALIGAIISSRKTKLDEVAQKLDEHVEWEMRQKYAQPWDGVERRKQPPPP